ncbi:dTDP-4-dehydrorhamnose reductase [Streptomyces sp. NPDC006602]|uniref:dTDP-4-dehydrorhamnose reductase n=1 Tax=Streptomyces sp. NPDC006602 TaxID=3364751 RepID=UPI0036C5AB2F
MRVYLTGADGMLGTAFTAALRSDPVTTGWPLHGVSAGDFDIGDRAAVAASIDAFRPDVVVHTAAHAIVDDCEVDPALAARVNVAGVRHVADACRRTGSRLINLSSDYVFDGEAPPPRGYDEDDLPTPLSVYGMTKVAGERIAALVPDHLNVRTSWLFGGSDERLDTVLSVVRKAGRGERAALIHDQFSLPTYTADLAEALVFLLTTDRPVTGTLHLANRGTASWYEVGEHVLSLLGSESAEELAPEPVSMADAGFIGGRPTNSTLSTDRLSALGFTLPSWQDAVARYTATLVRPTADAAARGAP